MKLKSKSKLLGITLCLILLTNLIYLTVFATDPSLSDDIVILYTNDIHAHIDGELSYDVMAGIKKDLQTKYKNVLLVDAGDHIQGTAYGSTDKGKSIIKLMNASGYDLATLGKHEFDYNMQSCMDVIGSADFPYVSCNFYHEENGVRGNNVLDSYHIFNCGDEKIAFVGITTPVTLSNSSPIYFQNSQGEFIYGVSGGDDGSLLYADVQKAVNDAKTAGATKVIALGHLGIDPSVGSWTSEATIANVSGLDAFIDANSHTVMKGKSVTDKNGNSVTLTQTGENFDRIGIMVIDSETNKITTDFIEYDPDKDQLVSDIYDSSSFVTDKTVKALKDTWMADIENLLGQKIGSTTVIFDNYDQNGNRLVRMQETNTGDFTTDALYYLFDNMGFDVDLAVMNGGGIRNKKITGDLTYKLCIDIYPFGNEACLNIVTGQQILDMLEWGARHAGEMEDGAFLQVSGITYKVDTSIPDTIIADDMDIWLEGPSTYRVYDVKVYDKEDDDWYLLEPDKEYRLAGYNYMFNKEGDGFAMLNGATNVINYAMEDYMVLANYIKGFENGVVEAKNSPLLKKYPNMLIDYSSVNGSGRIEVTNPYIWVGGVEVTEENASDVFGDGKVSYNPLTNTLTLNGFVHEGKGFVYYTYEDKETLTTEYYSALIYSSSSLNVVLQGNNLLKNTFGDIQTNGYGNGIAAGNKLVIKGDGSLTVEKSYYGLDAEREIVIDGCVLHLESDGAGICAYDGSIYINNDAAVWIFSKDNGLVAWKDFTLSDSVLNIDAEGNGICINKGTITVDSNSVSVHHSNPVLVGTKLSINADGKYAIFSNGGIVISDKLTISSPDKANIQKIYNETKDKWYYTISVDNVPAQEITIDPIGYYVVIKTAGNDMKVLVPAGISINEVYCEMFGIDDFAKLIDTEKEGYSFAGWFTSEDCSIESQFTFDTPIVENITVYGKWDVSPSTIDQILSHLEDAQKQLAEAMESGDANLDEKISTLNIALEQAASAYQAADDTVRAELQTQIKAAQTTLNEAIQKLQNDLTDLKNALEQADEDNKAALEAKDAKLQSMLVITCVLAGVALCISIVFGILFFIDKRKKSTGLPLRFL